MSIVEAGYDPLSCTTTFSAWTAHSHPALPLLSSPCTLGHSTGHQACLLPGQAHAYVVEAVSDSLLCCLILKFPLQVLGALPQKSDLIAQVCNFGTLSIKALL